MSSQNVEALICGVPPIVMHPTIHSCRYRHHIAATLRDMDWQTTVLCVGGLECQRMAARDADWLQCENCRAWWHRACATVGSEEMGGREHSGKTGIFYCTSCRHRIQALKIPGGTQLNHIEEEEDDVQEEDNQVEDEGEKEFEDEEEIEEVVGNGEGTMRIDEIHEEEESMHLILGNAVENDAQEK